MPTCIAHPPQPVDGSASAGALRHFCIHVIDQALQLVAQHEGSRAAAYAGPLGAHLRHVIEHFEALLHPPCAGEADYDARRRDPALERSPALARARLSALRHTLQSDPGIDAARALTVRGLAGPRGEAAFAVASSLGRELVFTASHAVHHFALLRLSLDAQGLPFDADFGKAPGTIAHDARVPAQPDQRSIHALIEKASPCTAPATAP